MRMRTIVLGIAAGLTLGVIGLMTVVAIFVAARPDEARGATRTVEDFRQVSFSGTGELYITQGDEESLRVEASPRTLRRIRSEVRGDTLHLGLRSGLFTFFRPWGKIQYYLTVRDLSGLDLSGVGNTYVEELQTEELEIDMSGAGTLHVAQLDAEQLSIDMSGAGSMELAGRASEQQIDMSGVGSLRADDLAGERVDIELSGAGSATIWARENLDISTSGVGSVSYYGNPQVQQDTSGLGSVSSLGIR